MGQGVEGETPGLTDLFVRVHACEALVFTARLPSLTSDIPDFFFRAVSEVSRVVVRHVDRIRGLMIDIQTWSDDANSSLWFIESRRQRASSYLLYKFGTGTSSGFSTDYSPETGS